VSATGGHRTRRFGTHSHVNIVRLPRLSGTGPVSPLLLRSLSIQPDMDMCAEIVSATGRKGTRLRHAQIIQKNEADKAARDGAAKLVSAEVSVCEWATSVVNRESAHMHVQLCQRSKAAESGRNGACELVPAEIPAPTAGVGRYCQLPK
jgi:hypothetical protein